MSTRPSRSASIPIPRSSTSISPSRNIEDVISMPFTLPRRQSTIRGSPDNARTGVFSRSSRGEPSTSPVRPAARSHPRLAGVLSRSTPRLTTTFEPRIIRAESARTIDPSCSPTSPTSGRARRQSGTGRAPSTQRQFSAHFPHTSQASQPVPFTRPAYLEHAVLRHLLQAEQPSVLPLLRKPESFETRTYSGAMSPASDSDEDSMTSPPPEDHIDTSVSATDGVLRLPTRWSDGRHQSLTVSQDGRDLIFQGASSNDREGLAGAARTDYPIPPACGIYYFEVEVRSKTSSASISIGLTGPEVKLSRLPGWEPNSWGYHGDDGRSFASERTGTSYGPTYGTNDVIGCGVDFTIGRVFFTKNGNPHPHVFDNVGKNVKLYPSVGLKHTNDSIRVNLGQDPFKYDIELHVQNHKSSAWSNILSQPMHLKIVPDGVRLPTVADGMVHDDGKAALNNLVMSYLAHHGYTKTLRALQKDSRQEAPSADLETNMDTDVSYIPDRGVETRTRIVRSVIDGDLDTAISETQAHHPAVLEADDGLMLFKLRCRKFIELLMESVELSKSLKARAKVDDEMIDEMDVDVDVDDERCERSMDEALEYGKALERDYASDHRAEVKDIFMKACGAVAYHDPRKAGGEVAEVVGHEARIVLANELNQAILRSQGRPPQPALETFYRHTSVCIQQLALLGVGYAPFVDMKREFLDA